MLGETRIREITDKVLKLSGADQSEVMFFGENSALTRFANNYIHQNVAEINTQVNIRLVMGKKIGVASTNDLSDEGLKKAVEHAATITRFQLENSDFKSLPTPEEAGQATHGKGYMQTTAQATPEMRAEGAGAVCRLASESGLTAAGAFSTSEQELAVANSLGVFAYDAFTVANILTVVMGDNSSGYADRASMDVRGIDAESVAREAVGKATRSKDPVAVEPGEYTVVLEEYAVADLLEWLNLTGGFSALALQEERSFLKKGETITGSNINIHDDGGDPRGLPMGIDFEGVAKRRVDLIKGGVAGDPVYDSYTAGREEGKHSTGHALPAPNSFGPIPINLVLEGGDTPREKLTEGVERGIWVTRFHYLSVVHPLMTILTGMTRDGTFLIENGEITRPIKNLRFTQNLLEAWGDATLSRDVKLRKGELIGSLVVPAVRIEKFKFVSGTSF
jgi:predicted Zn-dependent protease